MAQRHSMICDGCAAERSGAPEFVEFDELGTPISMHVDKAWGTVNIGLLSIDLCPPCLAKAVAAVGMKPIRNQDLMDYGAPGYPFTRPVGIYKGQSILNQRRPNHLRPVEDIAPVGPPITIGLPDGRKVALGDWQQRGPEDDHKDGA